jgi:hypothetical protein
MAQLRRLAIAAEDPARLAAFYQEVFELERIGDEEEAVFLSDGSFNLALLPTREGRSRGLSGLGFETARLESIQKNWQVRRRVIEAWLNAMRIPASSTKCGTRTVTLSVFVEVLLMYRFEKDRCRFAISRSIRRTRSGSPVFTVTFSICRKSSAPIVHPFLSPMVTLIWLSFIRGPKSRWA